eukprot:151720_1
MFSIFKQTKKHNSDANNEPQMPETKEPTIEHKNDANGSQNLQPKYNQYREEVTLEECDSKEIKRQKEEEKKHTDYDRYIGIFPDSNKIETTMAKSIRTNTPVQYIVLEVNWSDIFNQELVLNTTNWKFDSDSKMDVEKGKDAWTIKILSPSECCKLIELCEMYGFEDAGYQKSYRSNTRLITNDKALSVALYNRIKNCCPQQYKSEGCIWEICGLNEQFRWCKYVKGQKFARHLDARFRRNDTEKSFYTVNIYLNSGTTDFKGGRTCFFNLNKKRSRWEISVGVVASPGLSLMFNQLDGIEHNGEEVIEGIKYLMRTDVMYRSTDVKT